MVVELLFWTHNYGSGIIEAIPKGCPTLQILQFLNIVKKRLWPHTPHPPFLLNICYLGDFRPLRGHLSFCERVPQTIILVLQENMSKDIISK